MKILLIIILFRCETFKFDGTPMATNNRKTCREVCEKVKSEEPWFGIEQEYTFLDSDGRPLSWPKPAGYPAPQGPCK
jgi:glutamine synthetase